jgi:hypothetical protein
MMMPPAIDCSFQVWDDAQQGEELRQLQNLNDWE